MMMSTTRELTPKSILKTEGKNKMKSDDKMMESDDVKITNKTVSASDQHFPWQVIESYFTNYPNALVIHHLQSYNHFLKNGIRDIFQMHNPIQMENKLLYLGGKAGDKIYFGNSTTQQEQLNNVLFPSDARFRNLTYALGIHYDIEIHLENQSVTETSDNNIETFFNVFLGEIPVMLMSNKCVLNEMTPLERFEVGECRNDLGGYFIVDGQEKCVLSEAKPAHNVVQVHMDDDKHGGISALIYSSAAGFNAQKLIITLETSRGNTLLVRVKHVHIPFFILMRALGVIADGEIIDMCLMDPHKYTHTVIELFRPSVHEASVIFSQAAAQAYIGLLLNEKDIKTFLNDHVLPHMAESWLSKAYFLGHMVLQILLVQTNTIKPSDKNHLRFQRIVTSGQQFQETFQKLFAQHVLNIKESLTPKKNKTLAEAVLKAPLITAGFKTFLARQPLLSRNSYNATMSQLRHVKMATTTLHPSHWGLLDASVAEQLTLLACISEALAKESRENVEKKIQEFFETTNAFHRLVNCNSAIAASAVTKIFVNGTWIGLLLAESTKAAVDKLRDFRRIAVWPALTSIYWDIMGSRVDIWFDAGRLCRPVFSVKQLKAVNTETFLHPTQHKFQTQVRWEDMVGSKLNTFNSNDGFVDKSIHKLKLNTQFTTMTNSLLTLEEAPAVLKTTQAQKCIIDNLDANEMEGALINVTTSSTSYSTSTSNNNNFATHQEIHPSLMFGFLGHQVVLPEHINTHQNIATCAQLKETVSLYHTNYQDRLDPAALVLHYGQTPLVNSGAHYPLNLEYNPNGVNVIVAVMTGYSPSEAVTINKAALDRGLFATTFYETYENIEKTSGPSSSSNSSSSSSSSSSDSDDNDDKISSSKVLKKKKKVLHNPRFNYASLHDNGVIVAQGETVNEYDVLINSGRNKNVTVMRKGTGNGIVDKSFTYTASAYAMKHTTVRKVRVRSARPVVLGDSFTNRGAQLGVVGAVVNEEDMPFMASGVRPDILLNPQGMGVATLLEGLIGKEALIRGSYGSGTAFVSNETLRTSTSSNNELLYNGETGEQFSADIFVGPIYTMRSNQMTTDKMSTRFDGLYTALTRQPANGRASLDYEGLVQLGLTQNWLTNSDAFFLAICNRTGSIAVYNEMENLFLSPVLDGPLQWFGDMDQLPNKACVDTVSRYGYDFSVVRVPFAFKLLMQELQTMNVQMRIITEGNVDQLAGAPNAALQKIGKSVDQLLQGKYNTGKNLTEKLSKTTSASSNGVRQSPNLVMKKTNLTINNVDVKSDSLSSMANKIASLSASLSAAASSTVAGLVTDLQDVTKPSEEETNLEEKAEEKTLTMAEKAAGLATPKEGSLMAVDKEKSVSTNENENENENTAADSFTPAKKNSGGEKKRIVMLT